MWLFHAFFSGKETQANEELPVLISSFSSKVVKLRVAKKADKHDEELLQSESGSDSPGGGLWNSITSTLTGSSGNEADKDEPLNIFCLASGHLYERLLKIMILSVKRTTQVLSSHFFTLYFKYNRLGWVKNLVILSFCCYHGYFWHFCIFFDRKFRKRVISFKFYISTVLQVLEGKKLDIFVILLSSWLPFGTFCNFF